MTEERDVQQRREKIILCYRKTPLVAIARKPFNAICKTHVCGLESNSKHEQKTKTQKIYKKERKTMEQLKFTLIHVIDKAPEHIDYKNELVEYKSFDFGLEDSKAEGCCAVFVEINAKYFHFILPKEDYHGEFKSVFSDIKRQFYEKNLDCIQITEKMDCKKIEIKYLRKDEEKYRVFEFAIKDFIKEKHGLHRK